MGPRPDLPTGSISALTPPPPADAWAAGAALDLAGLLDLAAAVAADLRPAAVS